MPPEPPRQRWWMARRVVLGAACIVLLSAGATVAVARNEVSRLTEALEQNKPVRVAAHVLAPVSRGAPQTLLLVGNDERPAPKGDPSGAVLPHSNEMLLVRIDPSKPTISMLSIPRELKVPIVKPDGEVEENRINAAYTYGWENGGGSAGGVKLMVETIKRLLGITINHVFITNFQKFAKAVNAMGCVYMTVDKRYHHVNEPGGEQYFEINLQPGYQKLCGLEALEFVANRHESTSLIRDARDQRFILEVKAQYGGSLLSQRQKFEQIFGKDVESTLASEAEVLQLLYLLIESSGKPVRQVDFQVELEPTFDSATSQQIAEAVHSFLDGTAAAPPPRAQAPAPSRSRSRSHRSPAPAGVVLSPSTAEELANARAAAPDLPFALEYPRARDSYAGAEPDELRVYRIHDEQGHVHPIYVIVIDRGELGQYYDVQGTTWTDPPFLADPGQTLHIGRRTYELYYVGERLRVVAWREDGAVYWIENTLTNDVSGAAMVAMAEQTVPVIAAQPLLGAIATHPLPRGVRLAPRSAAATSLLAKLGAALAVLGILLLGGLAMLLFVRQRELGTLRRQIAAALALEASGRTALAAMAAGAPPGEPIATGAQQSSGATKSSSTAAVERSGAPTHRRPGSS